MKKLFLLLTSVLLSIGVSIPVYAVNDDLSHLTSEIVTASNDLFSDKLKREITPADIDYSKAFQIYVGINLFETDIDSVNEIADVFGQNGYIYELPIYVDGDTLIINIAKGMSLNENVDFTEEEQQEILNNVGRWQVTAVIYYANEIVDYTAELEKKIGSTPENAVLVGGLPYFKYAVAILPDDSGNIKGLVPLSDVPGIEHINTLKSDLPNVLDYQKVKEYVNQLPPPKDGEAGTYGFLDTVSTEHDNRRVIGAAAVLVVGMVTAIVWYRKKVH